MDKKRRDFFPIGTDTDAFPMGWGKTLNAYQDQMNEYPNLTSEQGLHCSKYIVLVSKRSNGYLEYSVFQMLNSLNAG